MLLCNIINMYTERGGGTQTHRGCRDTHRERGAQTHRESEGGGGPDSQRKYRHSERDKLRLEERRGKR